MATPDTLSSRISASSPARFGVALFATLLALLAARATMTLADGASPYLTALVAVALSVWFCGTAPAVLSAALSLLTIDYWFVPPMHSFRIIHTEERTDFILFLIAAGVIVAIGEASVRERGRLAVASQALEEKVRDRTGELDHANHSFRQLTSRLLNLQDEERRRIARELHDNAGQALSALAMNLGVVAEDLGRLLKTAETVADSAGMVRHMSDDIRTMSYLLHPPLLDEMGLAPALRWFVEGFAERSKIEVELQCDRNIRRLPREVETAIFRIVQECLTNIHRHSGSSTAAIQVTSTDHDVRVEITDDGKGISPQLRDQLESGGTLGVGVRGMRERARQLGGSLEINSDGEGTGTRIVVRLQAAETNEEATRAARAGSFEG